MQGGGGVSNPRILYQLISGQPLSYISTIILVPYKDKSWVTFWQPQRVTMNGMILISIPWRSDKKGETPSDPLKFVFFCFFCLCFFVRFFFAWAKTHALYASLTDHTSIGSMDIIALIWPGRISNKSHTRVKKSINYIRMEKRGMSILGGIAGFIPSFLKNTLRGAMTPRFQCI